MFLMSLGARDSALSQIGFKVGLGMERKMYQVSGVFGCEGQRAFAEIAVKAGIIIESKMQGLHNENPRFLVFLGARDSALSQKIELKVAISMESNTHGFHWQNHTFLVSLGGGRTHSRRNKTQSGPQYRKQNVWISCGKSKCSGVFGCERQNQSFLVFLGARDSALS